MTIDFSENSYKLIESLSLCKSVKQKACLIIDFYNSRRINGSLEPRWIHRAYELLQEYIDDKIDKKDYSICAELIRSHEMADGSEVPAFPNVPSSPVRIIHEGWKIGTPTWIFLGRNYPDAAHEVGYGWVVVKRQVPIDFYKLFDSSISDTVWIGYHLNDQMGFDATNANCIGPAINYEDLIAAIKRQTISNGK